MNTNERAPFNQLLQRAYAAYDAGYADEVTRLAALLSCWLLQKAPEQPELFLSTAGRYVPSPTIPYLGFLHVDTSTNGITFQAAHQKNSITAEKWLSLEDYLHEIIFDDHQILIHRKDLLSHLSGTSKNQHLDPQLHAAYQELWDTEIFSPCKKASQHENLYTGGIPYALMRQMAYEIDRTLTDWLHPNELIIEESPVLTMGVAYLQHGLYFYEETDDLLYRRFIQKDKRIQQTESRICHRFSTSASPLGGLLWIAQPKKDF